MAEEFHVYWTNPQYVEDVRVFADEAGARSFIARESQNVSALYRATLVERFDAGAP